MTDGSHGVNDLLGSLLDAIRAEADQPSLTWAEQPTRLTGGFWAQIWRVELANASPALQGSLVARVMPDPVVAKQETAVQAYLATAGYPTPRVRLAAGPGPHLDQAWMLMDVASGETLFGEIDGLSGFRAIVRLPSLARNMPDTLARHAAALHRLDPSAAPPMMDTDDMIEHLKSIVGEVERDDLVAVADWLQENRPPGREVICHGDLHPLNILTDASGDTVLDWSAARIANPAYDVAYTCLLLGNPPLTIPRPLAPVLRSAGRWLANRFTRTYNQLAAEAIDPEQLRWSTNLQMLHVLAEIVEAGGEVSRDENHPFRLLEVPLSRALEDTTAIRIGRAGLGGVNR
ncbi:MAG: phosphotransferase [Acidimicrobiales bacterium]